MAEEKSNEHQKINNLLKLFKFPADGESNVANRQLTLLLLEAVALGLANEIPLVPVIGKIRVICIHEYI